MAVVKMIGGLAALKWRIMQHGPNDQRVFGLITGGLAATAVVVLSALAMRGTIDVSWLTIAITVFGFTWLLGPILLPGASPVLDPQWFRTLPQRPKKVARALAPAEAISVGTVITALALSSLVIIAVPHGLGVIAIALVAGFAQLFFLLWLGKCTTVVVSRLLRSARGVWVVAFQMSVLLAVSFAGWVPIVAVILPNLGEGSAEIVTPSVADAMLPTIENALLALPTGWSLAAVNAAIEQASVSSVVVPIFGLITAGTILWATWVVLVARTLSEPPARVQSNIKAKRKALLILTRYDGPVAAVVIRELKTWFRDPQRALELRHAWITPLLIILLVAPTSWNWALPFIGVMAALFGAMVAVNTYALDGTALWQLITTPGAIRADVRGRQLAWMLLFGLPTLIGTLLLCVFSQSPYSIMALGATLAATGAACGAAPLFSALMPAIGADARDRVTTGQNSGNAAGGQMMVFVVVAAASIVPGILAFMKDMGSIGAAHLVFGIACGVAAFFSLEPLTRKRLDRTGPALVTAMATGDLTSLRGHRL